MLNLSGLIDAKFEKEVSKYIHLRIKDDVKLRDVESIALYEQNYLESKEINKLCEELFGYELHMPTPSYIPDNVADKFIDTGLVPVACMPMRRTITAIYHPDIEYNTPQINGFNAIECLPSAAFIYLDFYQRTFGPHEYLLPPPAKDLFEAVIEEAIKYKTSDVTISSTDKQCTIYYNVRKKKIYAKRLLSADYMTSVIDYMFRQGTAYKYESNEGQSTSCDLNDYFRGRVECIKKYKGYLSTIRILPKGAFVETFDDLNITPKSQEFLKRTFLSGKQGMHLICGATMSGKNTTILSVLRYLVQKDEGKIVSIERPVEQELDGVEQISCDTDEEYIGAINSLTRHNPDQVYVLEINDKCSDSVIKVCNTGKCVFTTVHANGAAYALDRLEDITNCEIDKLLVCVQTIVYQELVRNDEKDILYPKLRYIEITEDLRFKLFDKTRGERLKILKDAEDGD